MGRLLRGELLPGGRCDLNSLAEAAATRTGFDPRKDRDGSNREGPYQHLGDEFVRLPAALREAGEMPCLQRSPDRASEGPDRRAEGPCHRPGRDRRGAVLKKLPLSRLTAQHDEISPQSTPESPPLAKLAPVPRTGTTVTGSYN